MNAPADVWEVLIRLASATLCGALLGFEREAQNKPAGLRTYMMVGLGAAAFTLLALELASDPENGSRPDPTRVMQGVVGGIGFLGAGTIIQSRGSVRGVTTAAGIWVMGAIGVACGGGRYLIALSTTGFAFAIMAVLLLLEIKLFKNSTAAEKDTGETGRDSRRGDAEDFPKTPSVPATGS
jgi:putative Mg2+ transporter-C (MgtC) family protein